MTHKVEIADTDGLTMILVVTVDDLLQGGTWYLQSPKMILHHNGFIRQDYASSGWDIDMEETIWAHGGNCWGILLNKFTTWRIVNREGTGTLENAWGTPKGLVPGDIEWSIVH
jgi:hypothetical protein